jgi:hypothetical protein
MLNHHSETALYKNLTLLILQEITEYIWVEIEKLTDREPDELMKEWTEGRKDEWMYRRMDGLTDIQAFISWLNM